MKRATLTLTLLCLSLAVSIAQSVSKELAEIVRNLDNQFEKLVPEGEIEGIMALYSEDAKYLPDNEGIFVGKKEIREYWMKSISALNVSEFKMFPNSIEGNKKLIYETGTGVSKFKYQEQEMAFKFKYVNVWKKEKDGNYKLVIDIYNRDAGQQ